MKKLLIGALSLFTIGFGLHVERINMNPSDLVTISEAEARRGGRGGRGGRGVHNRGGRRAHKSVNVNVNRRGGRGGAFVAGAVVGAAAMAIGTRHTRLPPSCTSYDYYGRPYYNCGGVYYQPVYDGPEVVYVVVDKP
jgi:hypothetical protein